MSHLILEKKILDQIFILSDELNNVTEFIKKHLLGFNLICDYGSEEELKEDLFENPLIEFIIENINSITYKSDLKKSINNNLLFNEIGEKNIFLLDIDDLSVNSLKQNHPYLFYNGENLVEFETYLDNNKSIRILKVTKDKNLPKDLKFENWNNLNFCLDNVNSIIIFDNYILKESISCKLNDNIIKLINEIGNCKFKISLTIITELKDDVDFEFKYDYIIKYIKYKSFNIEFNLINHKKHFYPRDFEGFHSRFILTNYYYIISTDSMSYFKPNGKIINSADLIITSNLFKDGKQLYLKEINSIKEYFAKINNNVNNPSKELKLMYKPYKNNPLLN